MRKRSIFMAICAFLSALSLSAWTGCANFSNESSIEQSSETSTSAGRGESSQEPSNSGTTETSETSEIPETSETPGILETPKENALMITAPTGEVFPYKQQVKEYLEAGDGADVADYWVSMENPYAPIQVKWKYDAEGATKFVVEYATKKDFSDALSVETSASKRTADLYNLYKATTYYVRITALNVNGETLHQAESEFETTALGPRVMKIDAIHNVRDLGGYETSFGKTLVQGIAYRGGSLTPPPKDVYTSNLSEEGKRYMSETLGIKGELDFRNADESGIAGDSVIPGAKLTYISIGGYEDALTRCKDGYRQIFAYFADENNYPMYYHCTGGADRTGTVTFLLHALLGVSELECIQGYEMTSFSTYGIRSAHSGHWADYFQPFLTRLKTFEGNTLQEKTENFLLSIGVTETEIYNIKAIFFGEPTKVAIYAPTTYVKNVDGDLVLSLAGKKTPTNLYLSDVETPFTFADGKIIVTPSQLPSLPSGMITGKVVFADGQQQEFELDWKEMNVVTMDNLFNFDENGLVVLTANKEPITSVAAVGYGKTAVMKMSTTTVDKTNGGVRVFIGSYGFECRGGEMRPYTLDANGNMKEVARETGKTLPNTLFNNGATLYMSVDFVDDKPVLTIKAEMGIHAYEYTYTFETRVANEISDENAKVTLWIRTDAVTSLTVYNTSAWSKKE